MASSLHWSLMSCITGLSELGSVPILLTAVGQLALLLGPAEPEAVPLHVASWAKLACIWEYYLDSTLRLFLTKRHSSF